MAMLLRTLLLALFAALCIGCQDVREKAKAVSVQRSLHERIGWRAEDFFDDPQVIALCKAIEANDLSKIDVLIAAGADVNARGKDNMTPLFWASLDNKLERFQRLLEHGADPNVITQGNFGVPQAFRPGESVTQFACETSFPGFFEAVFDHGGNPNLESLSGPLGMHETPLFKVIQSPAKNKAEKIRRLISLGADLNHVNGSGRTIVWTAVSWGANYGLALDLLKAGADPTLYSRPTDNQRIIHHLCWLGQRQSGPGASPAQRPDYVALVQWLEEHGESMAEARKDLDRWDSWPSKPSVNYRKTRAEIETRKLREPRWNPAMYFDDPQVVALCQAIDARNVGRVESLIAAGANVNLQGKCRVTPLFWAIPPRWMLKDEPGQLEVFTRLLELGADPNVSIETDSRMRMDGWFAGDSVTHLAAEREFDEYFEAVFGHGGDPNLITDKFYYLRRRVSPLIITIDSQAIDKRARLQRLLDLGANIDYEKYPGITAARIAVSRDKYDLALFLLERGARFDISSPKMPKRLMHVVLRAEGALTGDEPQMSEYRRLLNWLVAHGESISKAGEELVIWDREMRKRH